MVSVQKGINGLLGRELGRTYTALCFPTVGAVWLAISDSCGYDLPTVRLSLQTLSQIKPFRKPLLWGAFVAVRLSQGYTPPPSPVGHKPQELCL